MMYTAHHPCWDAKNRYGLPEEMDFDYAGIAHIIEGDLPGGKKKESEADTQLTQAANAAQDASGLSTAHTAAAPTQGEPQGTSADAGHDGKGAQKDASGSVWESNPANVPKALTDLMEENNVSEWDVQNVVAARGYYPSDVRIENYDPAFISGVLVGAWEKVYEMIRAMKETQEIPFN